MNQALATLKVEPDAISWDRWEALAKEYGAKSQLDILADIGLGKRLSFVVAQALTKVPGKADEAAAAFDLFLKEFPRHALRAEVILRRAETLAGQGSFEAAAEWFASAAASKDFVLADLAMLRQAQSLEAAQKEIAVYFKSDELVSYDATLGTWVCAPDEK